jgi:hypothetical protein
MVLKINGAHHFLDYVDVNVLRARRTSTLIDADI